MEPKRITRFIILLLFSIYFISAARSPQDWHFVDNINLVIHESGHTICAFFGEFIRILAGSLFQILIPAIFTGYFIIKKDFFAASMIALWVGQNFINVSVYAGDAIAMQLPLLGGDSVIHDWNYILSTTGQLNHTALISAMLYWIGVIIIIGGIVSGLGALLLQKDEKSHSIELLKPM